MQPLCTLCRAVFISHLRYPHFVYLLHKPCRGAAQFLLCRNPTSRLRLLDKLHVIRTTFGKKIVRFFSFVTNSSLTASISGCRGCQPLHQSSTATKSLSLFADFTLYKRTQKAVQSFHSDTALLISLLYFSL